MEPVALKLRLALSSAGSLLCTVHNLGEVDGSLKHSPMTHHTELMIFDADGVAIPYVDRMSGRALDAKDKRGQGVTVTPGEKAHLSHSRILYNNKGQWGISWGAKRYLGIEPGIYQFVAIHPDAQSSNIMTFDIPKQP